MPSIHKNYIDDVRGQIIGGDYGEAWLTYEGRKQSETFHAMNETEAVNMAKNWMKEQKERGCFYEIWPNKNGWRLCMEGI